MGLHDGDFLSRFQEDVGLFDRSLPAPASAEETTLPRCAGDVYFQRGDLVDGANLFGDLLFGGLGDNVENIAVLISRQGSLLRDARREDVVDDAGVGIGHTTIVSLPLRVSQTRWG